MFSNDWCGTSGRRPSRSAAGFAATAATAIAIGLSGAAGAEPYFDSRAGLDAGRAGLANEAEAGPEARGGQGARMVQAFEDWADRWSVPNAALVVMRGLTVTGETARGTYGARKAVPVASLSKAITGVCITKLIEDGHFTFGTRMRALLRRYLRQNEPADPRVRNITVGQLLTHTSGITYDPSQGSFPAGLNFRRVNSVPLMNDTFSVSLGQAPGAGHLYNNMNYVVLGYIIEQFSGGISYEDYCADRVLAPLNITKAQLNPPWRIMGAFGGWSISARDYAKFLAHFDPSRNMIGIPISQWPAWDYGNGVKYSIGVIMADTGTSYNFWHAGRWVWQGSPYPASFGAYYVSVGDDVRYVATYAPAISQAALDDLDSVMWEAAFP